MKELAGNPGGRPLNQSEPQPTGIPKCPAHLDKAAKQEWRRVSAELIKLGLLTTVDRAALAAYCQSYSRWITAEENLAKFGLVLKSPKSGFPITNPYVAVSNRALDQMRKFAVEFGLTPASRSRLSVQPPAPADPFEQFMNGLLDGNPADAQEDTATTSTDSDPICEGSDEREDSGL